VADLKDLRSSIVHALDEEENSREAAFSLSRDLIRSCRKVISELVQEKEVDLSGLRQDARKVLDRIGGGTQRMVFMDDALAEYCEAEVLSSVLSGEDIRTPAEMGIPERAFILGVSDVVGELRRVTLNRLLRSDINGAISTFRKMEEIGWLVEGLAYPSGMIPLKKKQDTIRSLLDRTRGELVVAVHSQGRIMDIEGGTDDG